MSEYVIFILTHGRPKNVKTVNALKNFGYTGKFYLVLDNEDKTREQYEIIYGKDKIIVFNKKEMADQIDNGNNFNDRRATVHARNACFEIARNLGYEYFILFEDDYTEFQYRYLNKDKTKLKLISVRNLDRILELHLEFFKSANFLSVAMAQGGDMIGGARNPKAIHRPMMRKCMNSFICSTKRPFRFIGQFNDDVNTYVMLGMRGGLFATIPMVMLHQLPTQKVASGMTDVYLRYGTYCKSFTTVMMQPSSVKVTMMNSQNPRLHHSIKWINTVPVIIDESHKKPYRAVFRTPTKDQNITKVYGESRVGPIFMPIGEAGRDIFSRGKITEADRLECMRRGAEYVEDEQPKTIPCINQDSK
jgi:hypothetical protein